MGQASDHTGTPDSAPYATGGAADSSAGQALLVVDAANVMGSRPDGWWRDRAAAARRVADAARDLATAGTSVAVVLEGAARAGVRAGSDGGLRVVHAAGSGDDAVVHVVAEAVAADADRPVAVVTSDRELRRRVQELGATTHGARWLQSRRRRTPRAPTPQPPRTPNG